MKVTEKDSPTQLEALQDCHHGRAGHGGLRRTHDLLNDKYPGHGISQKQVAAFIEACPVCQKSQRALSTTLVPIVRHLKTVSPGRVVGIDYLDLKKDKYGNIGVYVMRDHFTKFVYISPTPRKDATAAASVVFLYCVLYGAVKVLMSDPGSDFTSGLMEQLNKWFGIHHRLSLVDRHESNGVEGANKQILRHLRTLLLDEDIADEWSLVKNIGWAMFIMNSFDSSESGIAPYRLTFGDCTDRDFKFPCNELDESQSHQYIKELNKSLQSLTKVAELYQSKLVAKRTAGNLPQNMFQKGDLVLLFLENKDKPHKLHPLYMGPFEVIKQFKNDVEIRHLSTGKISSVFVSDLKPFRGDLQTAKSLAVKDADQHLIDRVVAYSGDPLVRTSMQFLVRFADAQELWLNWNIDLQDSSPYEDYVRSVPALAPLIVSAKEAASWSRLLRKSPVIDVSPNSLTRIDLRSLGTEWYANLDIPDKHLLTFMVQAEFRSLKAAKKKIVLHCPLLEYSCVVDNVFIHLYCLRPPPGDLVDVDLDLLLAYPSLMTLHNPILPSVADFLFLVGRTFYDPDNSTQYEVTRVVETRLRDIVAYVKPVTERGRPSKEDSRPYHVQAVVAMLPN